MAMFKSLIKKHRPAMLSAALGVTIASSLAMSMTVGQVFAKDHFAASQRMPTGFDSYLTSIHQIQTGAADDADVRLKGRLTGYLYDNNYEFTDEYGQSIEVELDDDTDWSYVHKDQLIEILGEVERNMFKVKVEAKYYRILEDVHPAMQAQASDINTPTPVAMSDGEPNTQDTDNAQSNNVSALSAMASDDANADAAADAKADAAAADSDSAAANATDDANEAADTDAAADDSSAPVLAPLSTAGITETSTTKNVSVKDKVVVSTTTTTVKTVTVSDGTTAAADTEQAEAAVAVTEVAATNSDQSASAPSSESKESKSLTPSDDADAASAVVTAAKTK